MPDTVKNILQVCNARGQYATIVVERDLGSRKVTMTSTEITGMRVYTERAELSDVDDDSEDRPAHPWVTAFNRDPAAAGVTSAE
jgi:hypothetical protein